MSRRMFVRLSIEITQSQPGAMFQGTCDEMGIALQGEDPEELEQALHESITVFLNTLEKHGEREAFFERNGIAVVESEEVGFLAGTGGKARDTAREVIHMVAMQKTLALPVGV